MNEQEPSTPVGLGTTRPKLLILALAVFAGVTTETLPVGLPPDTSPRRPM